MAKINMSEVTAMISEFSRNDRNLQSSFQYTKASGKEIIELSTFTGVTADKIKTYLQETHETMSESYKKLLEIYAEFLEESRNQFFLKVDPDDSSIVNQEYVRDWGTQVTNQLTSAISVVGEINEELRKISDISGVGEINIEEVSEEYRQMMVRLDKYEEAVQLYVYGELQRVSELGELQEIVKKMQNNIHEISEMGVTSYNSERITEFKKHAQTFTEVCTQIAERKKWEELLALEKDLRDRKEEIMRELSYKTDDEFNEYVRIQVRVLSFVQEYQVKIDEYYRQRDAELSKLNAAEQLGYAARHSGDRRPEHDMIFMVQMLTSGYTVAESQLLLEEMQTNGEISKGFEERFPAGIGDWDGVIIAAYNASLDNKTINDLSLQFREQRASELSSVFDYLRTTAGLNAAYKHNNPAVNNSNLDPNNRLDSMEIDSIEGKGKGFHGEVGHIQEVGKASGVEGTSGGNSVPQKARDVLNDVEKNNGAPPPGYKGGRVFNNQPVNGGQKLPDNVTYREYDVNPFVNGQGRGTERIVIGSDGSAWYTNDHYHTFTQIQ